MELFEKSEKNLLAADLLVASEYYSSSIHCYYYSTFQLMLHIVFNIFNIDSIEFNNKIKGKDSHNYLINFLRNDLIQSGQDFRVISNDLRVLKNLRIEADYTQKIINKNNASSSRHYSVKLNSAIKKIHNL